METEQVVTFGKKYGKWIVGGLGVVVLGIVSVIAYKELATDESDYVEVMSPPLVEDLDVETGKDD